MSSRASARPRDTSSPSLGPYRHPPNEPPLALHTPHTDALHSAPSHKPLPYIGYPPPLGGPQLSFQRVHSNMSARTTAFRPARACSTASTASILSGIHTATARASDARGFTTDTSHPLTLAVLAGTSTVPSKVAPLPVPGGRRRGAVLLVPCTEAKRSVTIPHHAPRAMASPARARTPHEAIMPRSVACGVRAEFTSPDHRAARLLLRTGRRSCSVSGALGRETRGCGH